jgi:hypothetical protein
MVESYTANQGIEKPATGEQSGTWGATVNTNMDIIDRAISGVVALTLTGSTTTLTTTDGTLTDGMYRVLVLGDSGDLGSNNTITISPNDQDKLYLVYNNLTANRSAIFSQGSGANATVENGETAWIYADGAGSGAAVRVATSSTKLLDQDGDTGIRVEEGGDDDDTIRFDIAGAEDFTMTANTFTALSGSDIAIASGATITNSGTATGFGADAERAFAGVLEANATFVDQVIFGPAVDGRAWNGLWEKNTAAGATLYTSLMLATIEDATADTQINIWDLTAQSSGAASTSAIGTVTLSGDATPTSIAACMGYLIIGSEDGASIVDPHSGTWEERTIGWPRTLSTGTTPALTDADVQHVAAGFSDQPVYDPRTGGPMPTFAVDYGAGADVASLIKDDGRVIDKGGTSTADGGVAITNGHVIHTHPSSNAMLISKLKIAAIDSDDWDVYTLTADDTRPYGFDANTAMSFSGSRGVTASTAGLTQLRIAAPSELNSMTAVANRAYNTGYMVGDIRGVWLASTSDDSDNEGEKDRSFHANNMTQNGTPTEGAVAGSGGTASELDGYSGFSTSNYYSAASNAEWDVLGTGEFSMMGWAKINSNSAVEYLFGLQNSAASIRLGMRIDAGGEFIFEYDGASDNGSVGTSPRTNLDDNVWHFFAMSRTTATNLDCYIDGVRIGGSTATVGSFSDSGNLPFRIGIKPSDASSTPATNSTIALVRMSASSANATQIRQIYEAEKGMFVASSKCTLQSTSTDAVLDVDVDPLTGNVLVTQTDNITVWDGLVVDSEPTVNSGNSEKGKLWGALRTEQNTANVYITAPVNDQRQINEMVRGLASDLPRGPDLSKAAAWLELNGTGTISITSSYNIKSVTDSGTGLYEVYFATPFKTEGYVAVGSGGQTNNDYMVAFYKQTATDSRKSIEFSSTKASTAALVDNNQLWCAFFGELANE